MSTFFRSLIGQDPPARPGELLSLAREISNLMAGLKDTPNDPESSERLAHAGEIFFRRMALAQGTPGTALDLLALSFNARQAVRVLHTIDLSELDESKRQYWTEEAEHALAGIQNLLEQWTGTTMAEMGFELDGGTAMN